MAGGKVKDNILFLTLTYTTIQMKNRNIQTEVDAAYLYQKLAEKESDPTIASVFTQMSLIEKSHAVASWYYC